jgi:hypothetical protein
MTDVERLIVVVLMLLVLERGARRARRWDVAVRARLLLIGLADTFVIQEVKQ